MMSNDASGGQAAGRMSNAARLVGALGLILLRVPGGRLGWDQLAGRRPVEPRSQGLLLTIPWTQRPPTRSASGQALREASYAWVRAQQSVARELESRLITEPTALFVGHSTDVCRQR